MENDSNASPKHGAGLWLVPVFVAALANFGAARAMDFPEEVQKIKYRSAADNTDQPALYYAPKIQDPVPLLVGLHTWSDDYTQTMSVPYAQWCIEHHWVFIHPSFRGPNIKPTACGSELVVKDILSAVEYAKKNAKIDEKRIYLVGASGGGYASLLMAGRAPEVWAGVSAWVPIIDLKAWHAESKTRKSNYFKNVEASCGGDPETDPKAAEEAQKRSASTYLAAAKNLPLDINAGIHDGHSGSVPISHSLRAFNLLAAEKDRISDEQIQFFVEKEKVPAGLEFKGSDALYGKKKVLFRRESGNARVTIFEGGHEPIFEAALPWLSQQKKK